jgi:CHASE2 domain-containing sensor protein
MNFLKFFKLDKNRRIDMCITLFVFLLLTILYTQTTLLEILERSSVDLRFFLRDPGEKSVKLSEGVRAGKINPRASSDIIILGIDETTVRFFSEENIQWHFPWEIHTQLVNFIRTGNPKSIFFDITFIDHKKGEAGLAQAFEKASNVFLNYPLETTEISQKYSDYAERLELISKWKIKPINNVKVPEFFEGMVPPIPPYADSLLSRKS